MNINTSRYSTLICPQYNRSGNGVSVICPFYGVKNSEFVRIALGEKFTTTTKKEVNNTYDDWVNNLNKMVQCSMIDRTMMLGFLEYNLHNRKENEEEDPTNPDPNTTQVKVCCGHVNTY